jgi:hypothetical protein
MMMMSTKKLQNSNYQMYRYPCNACVELCNVCAEECEKHQDMEYCKLYAQPKC